MSIDTEAVRSSVNIVDVVSPLVALQREGRMWKGRCPFHDDRSPSFYVSEESQRYWCFGCTAKGDVIDFVMRYYGVEFLGGIELLDAGSFVANRRAVPSKATKGRTTRNSALDVLRRASDKLEGTPVEAYLVGRGLPLVSIPRPLQLRFARLSYRGGSQLHPALVFPVEDLTGQITGIQRIFLTNDGRKLDVEKPKLSLGTIKGSAARLGGSSDRLIVCEGLEDGLSIWREMPEVPVWVAAGAGMLAQMQLPDECGDITIAADNDEAGRRAADEAAAVFQQQGKRTRIMRPPPQFKDFNEQAQKARHV